MDSEIVAVVEGMIIGWGGELISVREGDASCELYVLAAILVLVVMSFAPQPMARPVFS